MVIAIISLSIMLFISIIFNIFIFKLFNRSLDRIITLNNEFEELEFMEGIADIPEEKILQKFEDATLFCNTVPTKTDEVLQIYDTSLYLKNKIIGLTYFVPEQDFTDIKNDLQLKRKDIEKHIRQKLAEQQIEVTAQEFEEIMMNAMEQAQAAIVPLLPHCTVYQLTDGRWLWRKEEDDG